MISGAFDVQLRHSADTAAITQEELLNKPEGKIQHSNRYVLSCESHVGDVCTVHCGSSVLFDLTSTHKVEVTPVPLKLLQLSVDHISTADTNILTIPTLTAIPCNGYPLTCTNP